MTAMVPSVAKSSNMEKMVTWGLLAFIAYELWKPSGLATVPAEATGGPYINGTSVAPFQIGNATPVWIQQLSQETLEQDYFKPQTGMFGWCNR